MRILASLAIFLLAAAAAPQAAPQPSAPPAQTPAADRSGDEERLTVALQRLEPQRPGVVDAYVLAMALDGDPVFGREARAAGEVLQRRYNADGRTIVLAGSTGGPAIELAQGSPANLARVLERIAELMDEEEDVLILYSTSHGLPTGLGYRYAGNPTATVSPLELRGLLQKSAIRNRLLIINACYSGVFIPALQSPESVIVTAASRSRPSFGCVADSDWTFFGDAMVNNAFRKPQSLGAAFSEAASLVSEWESRFQVPPSQPQVYFGSAAYDWLRPLERRLPATATRPVGRPAIETSSMNLRVASD